MSIFDENANDIEKNIFKNPLTQLSQQAEEHLFDEIEDTKSENIIEENSPFQDSNSFNQNNTQQQTSAYSNNNEDDFLIFEEDNEQNYDNNRYQSEQNQYNTQSYYNQTNQEYYQNASSNSFEQNNNELIEEEYVEEDDNEDEEYEYEYEYEYEDDDENYNEKVNNNQETYATDTQNTQNVQTSNPYEHLSVQSRYIIDSNRGLAQVSVDGVNALIGYVGSKISVIRKFNEEIKTKMQVRLNDQPDENTMIYIVKIGSYKTLVEVKPNSIRQLLDL